MNKCRSRSIRYKCQEKSTVLLCNHELQVKSEPHIRFKSSDFNGHITTEKEATNEKYFDAQE